MAAKKEVINDTGAEKGSDEDKGMNPLFAEMPKFEVEGRKYTMRRLGIVDALAGLRVFSAGSSGMIRQMQAGTLSDPQTLVLGILAALPYAENHVKDLVAGILTYEDSSGNTRKVTNTEFDNPDLFPITSLVDIIEGIGNHPDLRAFLGNVKRLRNSKLWEEIQNTTRESAKTPENPSSDN